MAETDSTNVKQEDFLAFLKQYAPPRSRTAVKDTLNGHYRIVSNQPLAEFSSAYAKAYAARDDNNPDHQLYALIFENGVPIRQKNIQFLKSFRHPSLVSLLAEGIIETGAASEMRYAVILEKPAGQSLAHILAQRANPMSDIAIASQYLRPLTEILSAFVKAGISHNRINPHNIYISGGNIVLGECISEPSGFSQEFLFEPLERMLILPRAKADFAPSADCYALAILALHLALGFAPFAQIHKDVILRNIFNQGTYHALIMPWDLPNGLQDFFRGTLGEGRRDRWDIANIESWLGGRRFNLILPTLPIETTRGFEFHEALYLSRKHLAYAMWENWKEARTLLTDNRLTRWLAVHVHKADIAELITRLTITNNAISLPQENELLARILILLDPTGPLRFKHICVSVEAIGALLASAIAAERSDDIRAFIQILDADLPGFWLEQQKSNPEYVALASRIQKARNHLHMKGLGFGIERCLYDLNPNLPCLSPMLKGQYAMTLSEALVALDNVAAQNASHEVGDAHLAAFITNRLDLNREIKLQELNTSAELMKNHSLVMLKILAHAQSKAKEGPLKGLSYWFAARLLPLLDGMHSRARQRRLRTELQSIAAKGVLENISGLLLSAQGFEADGRDFNLAVADYAARRNHIAALKNPSDLAYYANIKGRGIAQSIAYSVCLATVYITLKSYFHI